MANNDVSAKFDQLFGGGGQASSPNKGQQIAPGSYAQFANSSQQRIENLKSIAQEHFSQRSYDAAKAAIDEALNLAGASTNDHFLLIMASDTYRSLNLFGQAIDFADRAIALNPSKASYYVSKGAAQAFSGQADATYPIAKATLLTASQKAILPEDNVVKSLALGLIADRGFEKYILELQRGEVSRGGWLPEVEEYARQSLALHNEQIFAIRTLNHIANERQQIAARKAKSESVSTGKISLAKGQKVTLEKNQGGEIIVENGWSAYDKDYDLKAVVRYRDGRLVYVGAANDDEVMSTPDGAVSHGGDVLRAGELERIRIKWNPNIASVAVSSYSALENGAGSFSRYGVFVRIINGNQVVEIPATNTSVNESSYTLCFGEILFGQTPGALQVIALEMYSSPASEFRVGYIGPYLFMDKGPIGRLK